MRVCVCWCAVCEENCDWLHESASHFIAFSVLNAKTQRTHFRVKISKLGFCTANDWEIENARIRYPNRLSEFVVYIGEVQNKYQQQQQQISDKNWKKKREREWKKGNKRHLWRCYHKSKQHQAQLCEIYCQHCNFIDKVKLFGSIAVKPVPRPRRINWNSSGRNARKPGEEKRTDSA